MTMQGNPSGGRPRFTIERVISASLNVVSANVLRFLAIILAVVLPGAVLIALAILVMTGGAPPTSTEHGLNFKLEGGEGAKLLFILFLAAVGLAVYVLIQSAITTGALQTLRGRKATIGACLSNGIKVLPRVYLASLCLGLAGTLVVLLFRLVTPPDIAGAVAILYSLAFLAATSFILVLTWVYIPVIIVERAGPIACFRRSLALTAGRRWPIFGIFALILLANWLVGQIGQILPQIGAPAAGSALSVAAGLFFMALSGVLAAVGYYGLRAEKEGVTIEDIAKVFD